MSFDPRSLVGMTMGARKRKAQAVAYRYIADVTMLSAAERLATKADAARFRERGFPRHDYDRAEYAMVRACYRIGERLRPCPGCQNCASCIGCEGDEQFEGNVCESCGRTILFVPPCDGSGVFPADTKACPGCCDCREDCSGYGFFPGGDPRDFAPDPDCSTEEERAQHAADCAAWNRGERPKRATPGLEYVEAGFFKQRDGTPNAAGYAFVERSSYGLGGYQINQRHRCHGAGVLPARSPK